MFSKNKQIKNQAEEIMRLEEENEKIKKENSELEEKLIKIRNIRNNEKA
ncbi:MAG: hypothetical protein ACK5NF_06360 [Bacilli bacterium]